MANFTYPHNFWKNIPEDCAKAVKELKHLKVFNLCAWDYEETFTDVWWLVLHEVDLYAEGEYGQGEGFIESDPAYLNSRSAKAADKWLVRWWGLAYKYSTPGNFTEEHDKYIGWFGDGISYYDGQVI